MARQQQDQEKAKKQRFVYLFLTNDKPIKIATIKKQLNVSNQTIYNWVNQEEMFEIAQGSVTMDKIKGIGYYQKELVEAEMKVKLIKEFFSPVDIEIGQFQHELEKLTKDKKIKKKKEKMEKVLEEYEQKIMAIESKETERERTWKMMEIYQKFS